MSTGDAAIPHDEPRPAATPVPVVRIQPSRGWANLRLGDVWEYRELLYFLAWPSPSISATSPGFLASACFNKTSTGQTALREKWDTDEWASYVLASKGARGTTCAAFRGSS